MVGIAQLAEHRIVVPGVVGSSPITHPILVAKGRSVRSGLFHPLTSILGCSQVVRHGTLTPAFVGSSPTIPAIYDLVAQLVEQRPFKAKVRGSSPRRVTKIRTQHPLCPYFYASWTRTPQTHFLSPITFFTPKYGFRFLFANYLL